MLQDLGVLAPSLIVGAAFLAGVFVLLRREMAPKRRNSEDEDLSTDAGISDPEDDGQPASSAPEDIMDGQPGPRSRE
jgi:hypothetical protein